MASPTTYGLSGLSQALGQSPRPRRIAPVYQRPVVLTPPDATKIANQIMAERKAKQSGLLPG